ncbi:AAA ATPase central domain-containing protein (plasmid) [Chondrocystis sp. NIES-4102]|nr:AAA ATPase central domain-containing protein [Chondrocystis sp. NIES-4102]
MDSLNIIDWKVIDTNKIVAIEFFTCDRSIIFKEIAQYYNGNNIYFWNQGCTYLQQLSIDGRLHSLNEYIINCQEEALELIYSLNGFLILGGVQEVCSGKSLASKLENLHFDFELNNKILLTGHLIKIADSLNSIVPKVKLKLPNALIIRSFLERENYSSINYTDYVGLSLGEVESLAKKNACIDDILSYKTAKLAAKGLRITPEPDVKSIGGLDLLMRDLNKIKKLFLPSAMDRGLRPPKGCLLWGLPGTGKSLTAKMLSKILKVPLISCDWNELVSSTLQESLQNLDLVFQLVDSIGACIIFFDEFEKAFFGWNSEESGGVMAKMAGYLLSWMQDHTSPSIMIATINRIDMLPPELIRRFEYIWFFDLNLHNGTMWEILKIHIDYHFPGFHPLFSDEDWYRIFSHYRSCSPSELSLAVRRTHDEIFYLNLHTELTVEILIEYLIKERAKFKPAVSDRIISDALAKIRRNADYARPVQGEDRSRFASPPVQLFQKQMSQLPKDYTPAI